MDELWQIFQPEGIYSKEKREELSRESILVADALRLAKSAFEREIALGELIYVLKFVFSGGDVNLQIISRRQPPSQTRVIV
jgi:hypothetical protein